MTAKHNVNLGLDAEGNRLDGIEATALRRHLGNAIVVPPVRGHFDRNPDGSLGDFVVTDEAEIVDGQVRWHSNTGYPISTDLRNALERLTSPPFVPFPVDPQDRTAPHGDPLR